MRVYVSIPSWSNKDALKNLKQKVEVVVAEKRPTRLELKEVVQQYDGVIIGRLETVDKDLLRDSTLKFIGLLAKGTNTIDIEECRKKNVAVFYTPEANITSVSEHILTLILSLSKNLVQLDRSVRNEQFDTYRHSTIDVKDKTLGIIGAGAIATEVIKRAAIFGMNILCYTPHPENHKGLDVTFVTLADLLKNSDFVSINIPLTTDTENFFDKEEFSMMKRGSFLINTSRGRIVNEHALVHALESNKISGAGIDVFEEEPTHNKDLFNLNNVILTPHVAGISQDALHRMEMDIVDDIIGFLEKKAPTHRLV